MDNEISLLTNKQQQQDKKLCGTVEIDQLRSAWKARKFAIQVSPAIVQCGLLPSIFDWQFLENLMPTDQTTGELMLQQRIDDLELLNGLTTSLQRIQILPENGVEVALLMGRPSYNVQVQNDGSILVKELPSLYVHVYAGDAYRAAAGQESMRNDEPSESVDNKDDTTVGAILLADNDTDDGQDETIEDAVPTTAPKELVQFAEAEVEDEEIDKEDIDEYEDKDKDKDKDNDIITNVNEDDGKLKTEPTEIMHSPEQESNVVTPTNKRGTKLLGRKPKPKSSNESDKPNDSKLHPRIPLRKRFRNWLRQILNRLIQ